MRWSIETTEKYTSEPNFAAWIRTHDIVNTRPGFNHLASNIPGSLGGYLKAVFVLELLSNKRCDWLVPMKTASTFGACLTITFNGNVEVLDILVGRQVVCITVKILHFSLDRWLMPCVTCSLLPWQQHWLQFEFPYHRSCVPLRELLHLIKLNRGLTPGLFLVLASYMTCSFSMHVLCG